MSRFNELIMELWPDGVVYKRLEDCCTLEKGNTPIQKAVAGRYPLVVTTAERRTCNVYQFDKPTVCIPLVSSRGHGVASLNRIYYQEGRFALGNILCGVTPKDSHELSAKFLHCYLNHQKDILIVPLMKGGANVSLTVSSLKKVKVPVPPLAVQDEIVNMLSNFENLILELTAELTARKKQYEYYSKKIFDTAKVVEMVRIGDLGIWSGGMTPSMSNKAYWENGNIPWISSKDMKNSTITDTQDHITELAIKETSAKLLPANITTIVARSGILKHTLPVVFVPFVTTVNQDIKALKVRSGIHPRYAYFVISAHSEEILRKTKKSGGTVDSLDVQAFMNFMVPLVVMDEQVRIISIMDRFDTLVNDINQGLPAEIEARRKQYEYYRNKLLTFKEAGA